MQERSTHFPSHFYPRPPRGGRPPFLSTRTRCTHFYPRPPRGGRRLCAEQGLDRVPISIHALREEGDKSDGGRRPHRQNFYPRPPRGGRHSNWVRFLTKRIISIHALREEGDQFFFDRARAALQFLSTPSARRATIQKSEVSAVEKISIHALREEGDISKKSRYKTRKANFYPRPPRGGRPLRFLPGLLPDYFYPRPPRGGRHDEAEEWCDNMVFLSTPSARRATFPSPMI